MGGTSGAIYAIFLNAVANSLITTGSSSLEIPLEKLISNSLCQGLNELCRYTPARVGHRTLMDALIPFVNCLSKSGCLHQAIQDARKGAEGTRNMAAALGRASYVDQDRFEEEGGIPDPGALGVVSILRGIEASLNQKA